MKLARIVYKDYEPWGLSDGGEINPPIGTIVQYEESTYPGWYRVYFPGCVVGGSMNMEAFNVYFEGLTDETGEDN